MVPSGQCTPLRVSPIIFTWTSIIFDELPALMSRLRTKAHLRKMLLSSVSLRCKRIQGFAHNIQKLFPYDQFYLESVNPTRRVLRMQIR